MEVEPNWASIRCQLCNRVGPGKHGEGDFINTTQFRRRQIWVHKYCLHASLQTNYARPSLINAAKEIKRAKQLVCHHCNRRGASVQCRSSECTVNYHLLCAVKAGCGLDTSRSVHTSPAFFCPNHIDSKAGKKAERAESLNVWIEALECQDEETEEGGGEAVTPMTQYDKQTAPGHPMKREVRGANASMLGKLFNDCYKEVCKTFSAIALPTDLCRICRGGHVRPSKTEPEYEEEEDEDFDQGTGEAGQKSHPRPVEPTASRNDSQRKLELDVAVTMMKCSDCGLSVHSSCYGNTIRGTLWLVSAIERQLRRKRANRLYKDVEWQCNACSYVRTWREMQAVEDKTSQAAQLSNSALLENNSQIALPDTEDKLALLNSVGGAASPNHKQPHNVKPEFLPLDKSASVLDDKKNANIMDEIDLRKHVFTCQLCPVFNIGEPMKCFTLPESAKRSNTPGGDVGWVHLLCCLWSCDVPIYDVDELLPILEDKPGEGVKPEGAPSYNLLCKFGFTTCVVCQKPSAPGQPSKAIECADLYCGKSYHPVCALERKVFVDHFPKEELFQSEGRRSATVSLYCLDHAPQVVYCFCKRPYSPHQFMVECDTCKDWFHGECVGIREPAKRKKVSEFECDSCKKLKKKGKSPPAQRIAQNQAKGAKQLQLERRGLVERDQKAICSLLARYRMWLEQVPFRYIPSNFLKEALQRSRPWSESGSKSVGGQQIPTLEETTDFLQMSASFLPLPFGFQSTYEEVRKTLMKKQSEALELERKAEEACEEVTKCAVEFKVGFQQIDASDAWKLRLGVVSSLAGFAGVQAALKSILFQANSLNINLKCQHKLHTLAGSLDWLLDVRTIWDTQSHARKWVPVRDLDRIMAEYSTCQTHAAAQHEVDSGRSSVTPTRRKEVEAGQGIDEVVHLVVQHVSKIRKKADIWRREAREVLDTIDWQALKQNLERGIILDAIIALSGKDRLSTEEAKVSSISEGNNLRPDNSKSVAKVKATAARCNKGQPGKHSAEMRLQATTNRGRKDSNDKAIASEISSEQATEDKSMLLRGPQPPSSKTPSVVQAKTFGSWETFLAFVQRGESLLVASPERTCCLHIASLAQEWKAEVSSAFYACTSLSVEEVRDFVDRKSVIPVDLEESEFLDLLHQRHLWLQKAVTILASETERHSRRRSRQGAFPSAGDEACPTEQGKQSTVSDDAADQARVLLHEAMAELQGRKPTLSQLEELLKEYEGLAKTLEFVGETPHINDSAIKERATRAQEMQSTEDTNHSTRAVAKALGGKAAAGVANTFSAPTSVDSSLGTMVTCLSVNSTTTGNLASSTSSYTTSSPGSWLLGSPSAAAPVSSSALVSHSSTSYESPIDTIAESFLVAPIRKTSVRVDISGIGRLQMRAIQVIMHNGRAVTAELKEELQKVGLEDWARIAALKQRLEELEAWDLETAVKIDFAFVLSKWFSSEGTVYHTPSTEVAVQAVGLPNPRRDFVASLVCSGSLSGFFCEPFFMQARYFLNYVKNMHSVSQRASELVTKGSLVPRSVVEHVFACGSDVLHGLMHDSAVASLRRGLESAERWDTDFALFLEAWAAGVRREDEAWRLWLSSELVSLRRRLDEGAALAPVAPDGLPVCRVTFNVARFIDLVDKVQNWTPQVARALLQKGAVLLMQLAQVSTVVVKLLSTRRAFSIDDQGEGEVNRGEVNDGDKARRGESRTKCGGWTRIDAPGCEWKSKFLKEILSFATDGSDGTVVGREADIVGRANNEEMNSRKKRSSSLTGGRDEVKCGGTVESEHFQTSTKQTNNNHRSARTAKLHALETAFHKLSPVEASGSAEGCRLEFQWGVNTALYDVLKSLYHFLWYVEAKRDTPFVPDRPIAMSELRKLTEYSLFEYIRKGSVGDTVLGGKVVLTQLQSVALVRYIDAAHTSAEKLFGHLQYILKNITRPQQIEDARAFLKRSSVVFEEVNQALDRLLPAATWLEEAAKATSAVFSPIFNDDSDRTHGLAAGLFSRQLELRRTLWHSTNLAPCGTEWADRATDNLCNLLVSLLCLRTSWLATALNHVPSAHQNKYDVMDEALNAETIKRLQVLRYQRRQRRCEVLAKFSSVCQSADGLAPPTPSWPSSGPRDTEFSSSNSYSSISSSSSQSLSRNVSATGAWQLPAEDTTATGQGEGQGKRPAMWHSRKDARHAEVPASQPLLLSAATCLNLPVQPLTAVSFITSPRRTHPAPPWPPAMHPPPYALPSSATALITVQYKTFKRTLELLTTHQICSTLEVSSNSMAEDARRVVAELEAWDVMARVALNKSGFEDAASTPATGALKPKSGGDTYSCGVIENGAALRTGQPSIDTSGNMVREASNSAGKDRGGGGGGEGERAGCYESPMDLGEALAGDAWGALLVLAGRHRLGSVAPELCKNELKISKSHANNVLPTSTPQTTHTARHEDQTTVSRGARHAAISSNALNAATAQRTSMARAMQQTQQDLEHIRKQKALSVSDPVGLYLYWTRFTGISARLPHLHGIPTLSNRILAIAAMLGFAGVGLDRQSLQGPRQSIRTQSRWKLTNETRLSVMTEVRLLEELRRDLTKALAEFERQCSAGKAKAEEREQRGELVVDANACTNAKLKVERRVLDVDAETLCSAEPEKKVIDVDAETPEGAAKDEKVRNIEAESVDSVNRQEDARRKTEALARQLECLTVASWSWYNLSQLLGHYREWEWRVMRLLLRQDLPYQCLRFIRLWEELLPFDSHLYSLVTTALLQTDQMKQTVSSEVGEAFTGAESPERQSELNENKKRKKKDEENKNAQDKKNKNTINNGGEKEVEEGREEEREKSEVCLEDKVREGHAAMEVKLQDGRAPVACTRKSCEETDLRDDSNRSQDPPVDCDASVPRKPKVDQHSKLADDREHSRDIPKHETYSANVEQNTQAKRDTNECKCVSACSPQTGDVVWAKVGSLPFWPALVDTAEPSTKLGQSDAAVKLGHNRAITGASRKSSKAEAGTRTVHQARVTAPRRESEKTPSSGKGGHSELKRENRGGRSEYKRERLAERNGLKRERLDENKACKREGLTNDAGGGTKFASDNSTHSSSRKPDKLYTIRFFALPSSLLSCEVHDGPCACLQNDEAQSDLDQVTDNGPREKSGKTEVRNEDELCREITENWSKDGARPRSLPMYHHLMHTTKFFSQWVNLGANVSPASGIAQNINWKKYILGEKTSNSECDHGNGDQESEKDCNKLCGDANGDKKNDKHCNKRFSGANRDQEIENDGNKFCNDANDDQESEKDCHKNCSGGRSCFLESDVVERAFPTVGEAASLQCRPSDVLFAALGSAWPDPDLSMPRDTCISPSSSPSSLSSLATRDSVGSSQLSTAPLSSVNTSNSTSKNQPSVSSLPSSSLPYTQASKGSGSSSTHVSDFRHSTSTVPSSSLSSTEPSTNASSVSATAAAPPPPSPHLPPLSEKKNAELLFASSSKSNLAFSIGGASVVCWEAGLSREYPSAAASAPLLADALSEVTMYLRGRSEHVMKDLSRRGQRGAEKGKVTGRKNGRKGEGGEEDEEEEKEEGVGREGEQRQEEGERKQGRGRRRFLKGKYSRQKCARGNDEEGSGGDLRENKNRSIDDSGGRDADAEAPSRAENPNPLADKFRKPVKGQYKRVTSASSTSQSTKRKHSASERWIAPQNSVPSKRLKQTSPNVAPAHTLSHTHSQALGPSSPHSVQRGVEMKGEEKQLCKFCGNRASEEGSDRCSRLKCRGEARVALLIRRKKRAREETIAVGAQRNETGQESDVDVSHGRRAQALSTKGGAASLSSAAASTTTNTSSTTTDHSSSATASSSLSSAPSEGVSNAQRVGPQRLLWSEDQKLGGSKVERMRNKFKLELQSALLLPTVGQGEAESEGAGSERPSDSLKPKAPGANGRKSIAKSSDSEAMERQREMMLEMEDTRGEGNSGAHDNPAGNHLPPTETNAVTLAESIESALFKRYPMTMSRTREGKGYTAQARALMFNLKSKDNFELRRLVWTGRISPDRLAEMRSVEMASSSLKKWRQEKDKEHVRAILLAGSLDKEELR